MNTEHWRRHIDDLRVRDIRELVPPVRVMDEMPAPVEVAELVCTTRAEIGRIIAGEDARLLVVVGPCSVHDAGAALEYARWARQVRLSLGDRLLTVMRVFFEKPRTRVGWKGLINDPYLDGSFRINDGLRLARQLLLQINAMGVPTATEFVDPITPQYIGDLTSWAAIGARTSESQVHRELASGLSCPVGFKNTTSGDVSVAVNAVVAARIPHHFLSVTKSGSAAIVATSGNQDCHIILRGGRRPNYDEASVTSAAEMLVAEHVCPRMMVDCSHGNSGGNYREQLTVAREVARQIAAGSPHILGLMVESNLVAGSQKGIGGRPPVAAQSITDPCLGLDDTAVLLAGLVGDLASAPALS